MRLVSVILSNAEPVFTVVWLVVIVGSIVTEAVLLLRFLVLLLGFGRCDAGDVHRVPQKFLDLHGTKNFWLLLFRESRCNFRFAIVRL